MQQVISGAMLALKLVSAYFLIGALFALKKPKPIPRANPKTRFACVIAARNEERVIGELVQSLLRQNYPKTLLISTSCRITAPTIRRLPPSARELPS